MLRRIGGCVELDGRMHREGTSRGRVVGACSEVTLGNYFERLFWYVLKDVFEGMVLVCGSSMSREGLRRVERG